MTVPDWLTVVFAWFAPFRPYGELLGYAASAMTMFSLLFQPWRILKTKLARDVSGFFLLFFGISGIGWAFYGLTIASVQVLVCNLVVTGSSVISGVAKLIYDRRNRGLLNEAIVFALDKAPGRKITLPVDAAPGCFADGDCQPCNGNAKTAACVPCVRATLPTPRGQGVLVLLTGHGKRRLADSSAPEC